MPATRCKVGDEYYVLTFSKQSENNATVYDGELLLGDPLKYEYKVDAKNDDQFVFNPSNINVDIINAIKDSLGAYELNQAAKFN